MAESFSKFLGEPDARSAQFVRRGVRGVDVIGEASGLIEGQIESAKASREAEETSSALSSFQEQRTILNQQVSDTQSKINEITSQIANAEDRQVVADLTKKLQKLQRGGAAGASLTALRAKRGQLLSQFMATFPSLRQDFTAIDKAISGQDNDIMAAPTATKFDEEQAALSASIQQAQVHGISPEAVRKSAQGKLVLEMETQQRELDLLVGKKSAGQVLGVTNSHADLFIQNMHMELNAELDKAKSQYGAGGLPADVISELKARYKQAFRSNPQFNSYLGNLSKNYESSFITEQRNTATTAVDQYIDQLFENKDLLGVLERQRKVVGEVAISELYRGLPSLMRATVALDPTSASKIAFETYPKMINIAQQNGGTLDLMSQQYQLMLDTNNPKAEELGIALQWARQHGSVQAMIGHYTSLMSGQANLLGYKKGNAAQDQMLAKTGAQVAADIAADNPTGASTIYGDIINDAGKGNLPVLRTLLEDQAIRTAQNNPQVHKANKNASRVWTIRAGDVLGSQMGRDNLQFNFTPQIQATTVRDRGLGRRVTEPSEAFTISSDRRFLTPEAKEQAKALNYTYAYIHRVEGAEEADKWAQATLQELNTIRDTKREAWLTNTGKIETLRAERRGIDANIYMSQERRQAEYARIDSELDEALREITAQLAKEGITPQSEEQGNEQP